MIKKTVLIVCTFLNSLLVSTQKETHQLTVKITNLTSNKGVVMIGVYNNENDFLKKEFKGKVIPINNNEAVATFKLLPKGTYAVSYIHDKNNNGKLDKNLLGIPKESYGFSMNIKGFMGPPKYNEVAFEVSDNKTINIKN